ncbi:MAG TPA: class I SAM-dependent methyltransferase [Candidatus Limnocylindrales bacterium]|nr:class I SAM-dependent methyltransferase [Candidatus Limnocylindrales bacterium]
MPKADRVAEHNLAMWERLARAGMMYTRPRGRPPRTRVGMRRFMDPRQRLKGVRLDGARVLGLAAGGGWDPVIFAMLGAQTTVFDISPTQLRTVRDLARRQKVKVRLVRGNMKDLSVFKDNAFDVIWHCHSLVFVDDARRVLHEVGRVLAPGGTYLMSTMHPTTLRLYNTYTGTGWTPKIPYFSDQAVPLTDEWDATWTYGNLEVVAPTIEYGHRFETIVNSMAEARMVVDGLWEFSPGKPDPDAEPGSEAHLDTLFPAFIEVRGRKLPLP